MRFLCPVPGHTLLDQKRRTNICSQLNIFILTERTERKKENWYKYILKITTDKFRKVLLNYKRRVHQSIEQYIAR
jgi:hypothetical protein